jgi:hypothetical protein
MTISPTADQILGQLGTAIRAVLPNIVVVLGEQNRVAEPVEEEWVEMQPPSFRRLRTNIDTDADVRFTGAIAGTALTVSAINFGTIEVGATVFGTGVTAGTTIATIVTPGSAYTVSVSQTVTSRVLSAGGVGLEQGAEVIVPVHCHGPDDLTAGDLAQMISTMFRDAAGVALFEIQDPDYGVRPLYADDPKQVPFVNEQTQVEMRWQVDVHLQANQTVRVPQQYADAVEIEVISVDAEFPPT